MDFSRIELETLALGLDSIIRGEAAAMGQHGIAGLKNGRAAALAERLTIAAATHDRIIAQIKDLDDAEAKVAVAKKGSGG
jgi:hypothetical protein